MRAGSLQQGMDRSRASVTPAPVITAQTHMSALPGNHSLAWANQHLIPLQDIDSASPPPCESATLYPLGMIVHGSPTRSSIWCHSSSLDWKRSLGMQSKPVPNSTLSCLSLPRAVILSRCHWTWVCTAFCAIFYSLNHFLYQNVTYGRQKH